MIQNNIYKIFSIKLAKALCDKGLKCIGTEPNRKAPWLNVFLFENTPELQNAITTINN
jgi:hypothetical protein